MGIFRTKPLADVPAAGRRTGMRRSLGALDLTGIGIGANIGTGVFVLTGVAGARYAGPGVVLSFVVAGTAAASAAGAWLAPR